MLPLFECEDIVDIPKEAIWEEIKQIDRLGRYFPFIKATYELDDVFAKWILKSPLLPESETKHFIAHVSVDYPHNLICWQAKGLDLELLGEIHLKENGSSDHSKIKAILQLRIKDSSKVLPNQLMLTKLKFDLNNFIQRLIANVRRTEEIPEVIIPIEQQSIMQYTTQR